MAEAAARPGEAILIVDNDPINLKLARVLLTIEGYEVCTATDAEQVLRLLRDLRPRLILLDIQLPGMDGLALTRRLKADAATSDILIVALTACAMKGDEERARAAGCDDYVTKPIDMTALLLRLAALLAQAGGAAGQTRTAPSAPPDCPVDSALHQR